MGNDNTSSQIEPAKQVTTGIPNPTGKGGFREHPELINREGRPKRKTLTELIHAKLDDTPEAWNAIVGMVLEKLIKEKDKDVLKTFWQYTDGMPKQTTDITSAGEKIDLLHIFKPEQDK